VIDDAVHAQQCVVAAGQAHLRFAAPQRVHRRDDGLQAGDRAVGDVGVRAEHLMLDGDRAQSRVGERFHEEKRIHQKDAVRRETGKVEIVGSVDRFPQCRDECLGVGVEAHRSGVETTLGEIRTCHAGVAQRFGGGGEGERGARREQLAEHPVGHEHVPVEVVDNGAEERRIVAIRGIVERLDRRLTCGQPREVAPRIQASGEIVPTPVTTMRTPLIGWLAPERVLR